MATKRKGRSGGAARHEPTPAEKAKWAELVATLLPSASRYREYRHRVDAYLDLVVPAFHSLPKDVILGLRLRRSEIFGGREYLVAFVDDGWLQGIAPGCDAIASSMTQPREDGLELLFPPLVFLPVSKRRARNDAFKAVVEHEIVHLNQAILGTLPSAPKGRSADDLLALLFDRTRAEYEATFIQLVRWPFEYPPDVGLSLEHWCLLHGYSQALKAAWITVSQLDFPAAEVVAYLEILSMSLKDRLRLIGATEDLAAWFVPRLDMHLAISLKEVETSSPPILEHPAFRVVGRWLRPRFGLPRERRTESGEDE